MKKIVFVSLMMADDMKKRQYPVDGNALIEYQEEVYYAINAVLAKTMKTGDNIKIILVETKAGDKAGIINAQKFKNELDQINNKMNINATITYESVPSDFIVSRDKLNDLYLKLIKELDYDAQLFADISFGPKTLTLLIMAAMQFGEKFFNCSIGNVIYLKAEFKAHELVEGTQLICDCTSLYLLNSFTNTIEAASGEIATKSVEVLLKD